MNLFATESFGEWKMKILYDCKKKSSDQSVSGTGTTDKKFGVDDEGPKNKWDRYDRFDYKDYEIRI